MSDTEDKPSGKAAPTGPDTDAADAPVRRRRRGRRVGLVALVSVAVLAVAVVIAGFVLIGRPVVMPDWVHERIETQVNGGLGGAELRFGEVSVVVEHSWVPRVKLRDVDLIDAEGRHLISLSDVQGTLSPGALISGQVRPARIWLTGAQLALRRGVDGRVAVSFGEAAQPARQAGSFAELVGEIDRILETQGLSDLRAISADGLTIRYEDARAGRAWTVDGGRIEIERKNDILTLRGDFALLGGRDYASSIEVNYQSPIGSPEASFGMNFEDLATTDIAEQSAALLWLNVLRAPISGALRGSTDPLGQLGPLSATLQIGAGVLQPTEQTKPVPFRAARSYFTYSPDTQIMRFDEMAFDTEWGAVKAEGQVIVGTLEGGWPSEFLGQMRLSEISANPDNLYPAPIRFANATMDTRLELKPFRLSLGEMTLRDGEQRLVVRGELGAKPEGWDLSLSARMDALSPERLLQLWPARLSPNTREWIEANILSGEMSNIQLGLRAEPEKKPAVYLGFEFDKLDTLFMKAMPPIHGGRGHASLFRNAFTVTADAGHVVAEQGGAVDISGTTFVIPDVTVKQGPAEVKLRTASTITAALSLLDRDPLLFLTKAGQKVTLADGRAEAAGRIGFPLKKQVPAEEVDFEVSAVLRNVRSETVIPGRVLAAPSLNVRADGEQLVIEGAGRIGQVPVEGAFTAPLGQQGKGRSLVEGTVELSQRFVEEFRLGLPSGSVSGSGKAAVRIDLVRGEKADFSMRSDLSGLALRVAPIGWSMSKGAKGKLQVAGRLGDPVEVNTIELEAPGLIANGRLDLGPGGVFRSATFDRVRAGSWLDVPVTLVGRGPGRAPEVVVQGGSVDLSQTEIGAGSGSGGTGEGSPIRVALDVLKISEGISLTSFRGDFSTAKGMDGSFTGRVNGSAPVKGRVLPKKGRSAFRILSDDAGAVFKATGLLKNARSGDFSLTLMPTAGEGSYDGVLRVTNVWLQDAPAMAALLNAISVVGLLEQLGGNGIHFQAVDANFRLTPHRVIITKSSAIGNSLGISMDGIYDLDSGGMNMQGVVSPLYLLNGVASFLTRKGEGLIGFNYTLRGTSDRPRVGVNPLSILTPGMFREIFRRPPPKVSQ
jgi:hypothetical protein